jgi:poly-gamma-glutamate capsule biosynthesis protein CapA/YwtB (metallophosphatase superfamily)
VRRVGRILLVAAALLAGCATAPGAGPPEPIAPLPRDQSAAAPATPGFTVVAGGDVLIHPALTEQASADGNGRRDYSALLAGIKPVIEAADLAVCHLEVPLADANGPFQGYPLFSAPPEVAAGLAGIGYDSCSTASNHTLDHGPTGVTDTLDALDAAGLKHTGSARSAREAATPLIVDVRGTKVGLLSYTFGFNVGTALPSGSPWLANRLDPAKVLAEARKARSAGAEVVIASLHWGIEDRHEPTADQQRTARQLLADPAIDLIVGHHAHVVQPFEKIDGKWVAYGLGNQIARHEQPRGTTEEGAIARFHFTKTPAGWTIDKAEYIPTLVDLGPPIRLRDLTTDSEVDTTRKTLALNRTDEVILSRNAADAGLTRPGR